MESSTVLTTADGPMVVHWALPPSPSPGRSSPGILVFQEAFGVNPHIRRVCRRLAAAGYVAAAPELFHREKNCLEFGYDDFARVRPILGRLTNPMLVADATAAHAALSAHPLVDPGRIHSIGFCVGGFVSILAAINLPLATAVSFYGGGVARARPGMGLSPLLAEFERLSCPTLHVFGEKDGSVTEEDVSAVRSRLESLGKPHRIEVYPNAGHGFFCEDRPAFEPVAAAAAWGLALDWMR
jgi:carboxymethylenebutenolidase